MTEANTMDVLRSIYNVKESLSQMMLLRLQADGINASELMIVYTLQHKTGECKVGDLAESLFMPISTLSGVIDKMADKGLILKERSAEDKRVTFVKIDPGFAQRSRQYMQDIEELLQNIAAEMGQDDFKRFVNDLALFEAALSKRKAL